MPFRLSACCQPEKKIAVGFVEGLNNKIRVMQRRAYGLRDEESLWLKILTTLLPPLEEPVGECLSAPTEISGVVES